MAHQIALLAIQLGIIIFAAKLIGSFVSRFKVPAVMGELLAGVLLGPYCLGGLGIPIHGFEKGLFPLFEGIVGIPVDPKLYTIATLGSIVLLFISGLETDVRTFFKYSIAGSLVGLGGIIASFFCGVAVGVFVLGWPVMDPRSLFLGILCTATSVGISARILSEHKAMDTPEGVTIMAAAVIDDVLGIVCLAIVIGIANVDLNGGTMAWGNILWITFKSFAIWLGVTAVGLLCSRKLSCFLKIFKSPSVISVLAFGMALFLAGIFEEVGLAMIIGAFVMGLAFSKTDIAFELRNSMTPIYQFLVPIFFVVMGMLVDIRVLKDPYVLGIGLIFSFMAILGKVVGCSVPAFLMNFNGLGALRVGIGMIPRCEVVLIIAGIAATSMMKNPALAAAGANAGNLPAQVPIFDSRLFGIAIIMPLVTALLAPPLLNMVLSIKGKGTRHEVAERDSTVTSFDFGTLPIAEFVLNEFKTVMEKDCFLCNTVSKGVKVIQFRKDNVNITLELDGTSFHFHSATQDIPLIKNGIFESVVDLHMELSKMKQLTDPKTLQQEIHLNDTSTTVAPEDERFLYHLIKPHRIIYPLKATNKLQAIKELVASIHQRQSINKDMILQDILERETVVSTTLGNGIAMPHARTEGTDRLLTAIGISPEGIEDQDSDQKVHIVILSLCPVEGKTPYLQYISQMSQILMNPEKYQQILKATSAEDVCKILLG